MIQKQNIIQQILVRCSLDEVFHNFFFLFGFFFLTSSLLLFFKPCLLLVFLLFFYSRPFRPSQVSFPPLISWGILSIQLLVYYWYIYSTLLSSFFLIISSRIQSQSSSSSFHTLSLRNSNFLPLSLLPLKHIVLIDKKIIYPSLNLLHITHSHQLLFSSSSFPILGYIFIDFICSSLL